MAMVTVVVIEAAVVMLMVVALAGRGRGGEGLKLMVAVGAVNFTILSENIQTRVCFYSYDIYLSQNLFALMIPTVFGTLPCMKQVCIDV